MSDQTDRDVGGSEPIETSDSDVDAAMPFKQRINITRGHLLRHAPPGAAGGFDAAIIDVGQDLLLRHLHTEGALELVAFKGGTALRKLYAGTSGRFSTDLDFSVIDVGEDRNQVTNLLTEAIAGIAVGPFRFDIEYRRDRPLIVYKYDGQPAVTNALTSKLDVGPPPWLPIAHRAPVPAPIHRQYGGPMPDIPLIDLAENVAEKIARLNRRSPARDAYDLVWIAQTSGLPVLDRPLIRRLTVLKCWVDMHGLSTIADATATWAGGLPDARPFEPSRWIERRRRRDFDDENIGLLTTPAPDLDDLGAALSAQYTWLTEGLDSHEEQIARCDAGDRGLVLKMLGELPGRRLAGAVR